MTLSNRARQNALRQLQAHLNAASLAHGAARTQAGFVDLYQTPTNPLWLSYVTPRKGVALIPTRDVLMALEHIPQLATIAGLLAPQWFRQLEEAGLERAAEYPLMTLGTIPGCDQDDALIPSNSPEHIPVFEATNPAALALWLRLHRIDSTPDEVARCWNAVHRAQESYYLAADGETFAGAIMLTIQPPIAQLRGVFVTEAHGHKGIGGALVQAAVARAQQRDCTLIFTICEDASCVGLYKRQGFVKLDSIVVYRKPERHEQPLVQPVSPV